MSRCEDKWIPCCRRGLTFISEGSPASLWDEMHEGIAGFALFGEVQNHDSGKAGLQDF